MCIRKTRIRGTLLPSYEIELELKGILSKNEFKIMRVNTGPWIPEWKKNLYTDYKMHKN